MVTENELSLGPQHLRRTTPVAFGAAALFLQLYFVYSLLSLTTRPQLFKEFPRVRHSGAHL